MATITQRQGKGGVRYTAQIRVQVDGRRHTESKTFGTKKAAQAWAKRRETELEDEGLPGEDDGLSVADACARYLRELEASPKPPGRSKAQTLRAMSRHPDLKNLPLTKAKSKDWLAYLRARLAGTETLDGRLIVPSARRLTDDYSYLKTMLEHALHAWGARVRYDELEAAGAYARKAGLLASSKRRDVRPTLEHLERILEYWSRPRSGRGSNSVTRMPMPHLVLFLIFSTRRVGEVCRIRWDDLDRARSRLLVRDMKHPREKEGNNVWVHLPARAMSIIDQMPQVDERIFPYDERSVAKNFREARDWASVAYEDDSVLEVTVHDLRHEGISHLFELGWDIPRVAMVSGHRSWDQLRRYTHLMEMKPVDRYAGWDRLQRLGVEPLVVAVD